MVWEVRGGELEEVRGHQEREVGEVRTIIRNEGG